jgi:large subunit ribosomal protein L3
MTKAIFGRKVGMTQVFTDEGRSVAVTVIEAKPCVVVRKRTSERDGYEALQVGFGEVAKARVRKPVAGQFKASRLQPTRCLRELRLDNCAAFQLGDELTVKQFESGERVEVTGVSKGKGFQGTIKRHGFHRGPMTHGSKSHRRPASTGATDAARVFRGKRSPGHMGGERVTVKGIRVERVLPDKNLLLVRGAVPGAAGSYVEVKTS